MPQLFKMEKMSYQLDNLGVVVVGASGDLATKKIFPALFALYCQGCLPEKFHVFGFARSELNDAEFRSRIMEHLTCRYVPGESCEQRMDEFLDRCRYVHGAYDSRDSFLDLYQVMRETEDDEPANRLCYLAIPPSVFVDVARAIGDAGLVSCGPGGPWSRVVIEKPFGRDRESSDELTQALSQVFSESRDNLTYPRKTLETFVLACVTIRLLAMTCQQCFIALTKRLASTHLRQNLSDMSGHLESDIPD